MNKIEEQMLAAIREGRSWKSGNTEVDVLLPTNERAVYLHGNHIATVAPDGSHTTVNKTTLGRWPTNTTKSRLRALGVGVTTVKGTTLLGGEPV